MKEELLLVEWVDSARPIPEWVSLHDLPNAEIVECVSVGWKVAESDEVLMLAPNLGDVKSGGSSQACGIISIPKAAITRAVGLIEND